MMLSAALMEQMSRLLEEALDLDTVGRRHWLESLSAEHHVLMPALRRALLPQGGVGSHSEQVLTLPDAHAALKLNLTGAGPSPGSCVGPYRLIRPLGAGGMAEVWLAQRNDGTFKRQVALKLPLLSSQREDLARRFLREREILAALEHQNIARLYDAGVSADGLPYLAMEYVRGKPLTDWCDEHRLGIRERLKLLLQALDAVEYAHRRQVIHRDIKPWNILVTYWGQVRLLDFGVAKLLARGDEDTTELTQIFGRAFTPEYASPELVRGAPIDATADVYSLGVVLYELLGGARPYQIDPRSSMTSLEKAVAAVQIEPPSTRLAPSAGADRSTTQQRLARRLRGDLDAITLKALAQAPKDRYASAAALARDLRCYLNGTPIAARPAGLALRLLKFVRRRASGQLGT